MGCENNLNWVEYCGTQCEAKALWAVIAPISFKNIFLHKNYQKYFEGVQKLRKIFYCAHFLRKIFAKTSKSVKN